MSAHAIVTAIEEESLALCRLRATGRQDVDLAARDHHCRRIRSLIRQLRPLIGIVEKRSFGIRGESTKGVSFTVARRARAKQARAA
ncbi:hypothetical protein [Methylobacterium sp. NEAU K]|uniref:hypothetical protein n=1 Tax=Methylobacterium sp. NEAU K TaxID=3064946 RepID=UPI0027337165|nr:hypothetical protein [Methylobacterium sp. NEAU K]MDP4005082.1 hypothetical protein [Methylobacterium sp. NEAU K]